ncbi:MAG TPA: RecQ family ATP-dependent DNA helicase, partial [Paludibacter sp.]|nr:RecQ family ATP-dependent DNA helicase [Paludibacter sp.]
MNSIAFIDTEIDPKSSKILDMGSVKCDGTSFHKSSVAEFVEFLNGTEFLCGHNILNHDIKYIGKALYDSGINTANIIDTLHLSPLLFPTKPYHALLKDDKLQSDELNNPLNDAIKARDLFYDEIAAFKHAEENLQQIFYLLLNDKKEFHSFFRFISYKSSSVDTEKLIHQQFENEICEHVDLPKLISEYPIEL